MKILRFTFGPVQTHAYLLLCEKTHKGAVIDPSPGCCSALLAKAAELKIHIENILLTHSHWDHMADAAVLKKKTGAAIYIHPLDAPNLEEPGADGLPLFIPIQGVKPDHFLQEGQIVEVGHLHLHVIHTPGHSPGGICFYLPEEHLLIAGDTLFKGGTGRVDFPTSSPSDMRKSVQRLLQLPPETRVVSGHGPETTLREESRLYR